MNNSSTQATKRPMSAPEKRAKGSSSQAGAELRYRKFAEAWLANGGNKTQAAIAAGCPAKGAAAQGNRLYNHAKVQAIIQKRQREMLDKLKISTERTLRERARLAYYDIGDLATASISQPSDISQLPEDVRQAITGWKWDKDGRLVLQFADKNPHLMAIERHLGVYRADNEQGPPVPEPGAGTDVIQAARAIAFVLARGVHGAKKNKGTNPA